MFSGLAFNLVFMLIGVIAENPSLPTRVAVYIAALHWIKKHKTNHGKCGEPGWMCIH